MTQKRESWEDPLAAYQRCFEHVSFGDVEADVDVSVVTLLTTRPKDLESSLDRCQKCMKNAMHKAFGRGAQLTPRDFGLLISRLSELLISQSIIA